MNPAIHSWVPLSHPFAGSSFCTPSSTGTPGALTPPAPEIPVCRFRFSLTQQSLVLPDPSNIFVAVWDRQASKEWSCGYMTTLSLLPECWCGSPVLFCGIVVENQTHGENFILWLGTPEFTRAIVFIARGQLTFSRHPIRTRCLHLD